MSPGRALEVARDQLRTFGAVGIDSYYGIADADNWAALLEWVGPDVPRRLVCHGEVVAETIKIGIGGETLYVQGPRRRMTHADWRRLLVQRAQEDE